MKETTTAKNEITRLMAAGYSNDAILDFISSEKPQVSQFIKELREKGYSDKAILKLLSSKSEKTEQNEIDLDKELTVRVSEIMHKIGVPAHIKGYQYLRRAIILATKDSTVMNGVTKVLYPTIAKEFATTSSRVERAIRHAIEVAWNRGNPDVLEFYFGYTIQSDRGKPTNSEFVAMISDNLRLKY